MSSSLYSSAALQLRDSWRMYEDEIVWPSQIAAAEREMDESKTNEDGEAELSPDATAFLAAAKAGRLPVLQNLLKKTSVSIVNCVTPHGESALLLACKHGRANIVEYLLEKIASGKLNIHHRDRLGKNALNYAAENGAKEAVTTLVTRGAELDAVYELSAFAVSSGVKAMDMHRAMYLGHLRRCVFLDLQSDDVQLIPDLIKIVFEYLF
jgi:hypothetical protein